MCPGRGGGRRVRLGIRTMVSLSLYRTKLETYAYFHRTLLFVYDFLVDLSEHTHIGD